MSVLINASTTSGLVQTADTSGTLELQSNGTTQLTVSSTGAYGQLKSGTAQASTSGTSIDFTGLPSWVKRVTVMFNGVSTNGTSGPLVQLGSGSPTTTGYISTSARLQDSSAVSVTSSTAGFVLNSGNAANVFSGSIQFSNLTSNTWVAQGVLAATASSTFSFTVSGIIALGGTLDRIRITTIIGTDTFDAGSINILYEG